MRVCASGEVFCVQTAAISDSIPNLSNQLPSPFPFYLSLLSIHAQYQRSCFWQELHGHFPKRYPKHAFLSHCPWPSLGSVLRPSSGRSRLKHTEIRDAPTHEKQSSLKKVSTTRQCISFCLRSSREETHSPNIAFTLSHQKGRRHWHCRRAARVGILPNPILSTPPHHSNHCLVSCTVTHRQPAVSTSAASAIHQKGSVC